MTKEIRVLVVDDEVGVCNSCMKTLSREGYQVDYVLDGEAALDQIAASPYDLVVTDLKMPKIDGMQLLKTVKARWPEVNVVMITGYGTIRSAVEAIRSGAFDYIPKPFTSEELAGVAARALGLTELLRDERKPSLYQPGVFADLTLENVDAMWCIPEHSWARIAEDKTVRVGLDAVYLRLLGGKIVTIELSPANTPLKQGEACARITVTRTGRSSAPERAAHNLWCPVGGTVIEANEQVGMDRDLVTGSPYVRGWLLRIEPSSLEGDLQNLKPFADSIGGRAARKRLKPRAETGLAS
jgi:FixJ family two-component response regulator